MKTGKTVGSTIGERIRYCRKKAKLSLNDLATQLGTSKCGVWRWEHGVVEPSLFNAICLVDLFGVSLDWLAGREDTNDAI